MSLQNLPSRIYFEQAKNEKKKVEKFKLSIFTFFIKRP
eukprot:SAG11_NODE_23682_length_384_cov_1.270175_1_plen_37_part_10